MMAAAWCVVVNAQVPEEPVAPDSPPGATSDGAMPEGEVPAGRAGSVETAGDGLEHGLASWYGARFAGRRTACGVRFDPKALTMAHPTLPCGSRARITNPGNHRSVVVRVTDRGPFVPGRIADLSREAARKLGITRRGAAAITIEPLDGGG